MKITLFTIISFIFLFVSLLRVSQVFAIDCQTLKGQLGPHSQGGKNPAAQYTGNSCSIPGQTNQVLECIGTTGYRYIVTYCDGNGCEEKYPEQGQGNAPAACNRPDQPQSEIGKIFGQITPPLPIQQFGYGSLGLSKFLTNFVRLIYIVATIVLVFMLIWGAWDWMTSEGDKEKLESAQRKIINAIIGVILFAAAFALLQVLGTFTGFKFFT